MDLEKSSDDLWIGLKLQSSLVIAGSPRNVFRNSLKLIFSGVELLNETWGPPVCHLQSNSEYHDDYLRSESAGSISIDKREKTQIAC